MAKGLFTGREYADIVELSAARVSQLTGDGIIHKEDNGKYGLRAITELFRYYRLDKAGKSVQSDSYTQRARFLAVQADLKELELQKAKGELVEIETVREATVKIITILRSRLLAFPSKLAPRLYGRGSIPEVHAELKTSVNDLLTLISNDLGG